MECVIPLLPLRLIIGSRAYIPEIKQYCTGDIVSVPWNVPLRWTSVHHADAHRNVDNPRAFPHLPQARRLLTRGWVLFA